MQGLVQVLVQVINEAPVRANEARFPEQTAVDDSDDLAAFLKTIRGPVVLVGHSCGGVISQAADHNPKVKALVYVAAFSPAKASHAVTVSHPGAVAELVERVSRATVENVMNQRYTLPGDVRASGVRRQRSPSAGLFSPPDDDRDNGSAEARIGV